MTEHRWSGRNVTGRRGAEVALPCDVQALSIARAKVSGVLAAWAFGNAELVESSALVVTELVANALRHAGGPQRLVLSSDRYSLTLAVDDPSSVPPRPVAPGKDGGRGLLIIEALCVSWGFLHRPGQGKRVWATFAEPTAGDPDRSGSHAVCAAHRGIARR
jgi:anti-sigma regulatory factor (Ser/Thr protein kinase)